MKSLEIKNITIKTDKKIIVKNVSLSVMPGKISVVMGQNGSGKSSLVNAIMGHPAYKIVSGDIFIDGKKSSHLSPNKKAIAGLFLSPQHAPTLEGIILSRFLYAAYKARGGDKDAISFYNDAEKMADMFGIKKDFLARQVNGGLSGGEKKMSELLQLAILKPRYAMLDEIDSGADKDAVERIILTIQKLAGEGIGFLLITHYDKILDMLTPDVAHVMYEGKFVRSGGKELATEIKEKGYTKLLCK